MDSTTSVEIVVNLMVYFERYTRTTQQLIDIFVKNVEVEAILSNRDGTIGRLEKSLREAFRGKDVNPYIYNIEPEFQVPQDKQHLFQNQKSGSLISIGSQRGFYPNVHKLIRNLRLSPFFCRKQNLVVLNKYFAPTFDVDWCFCVDFSISHSVLFITVAEKCFLSQVNATPAQPLREVGYTFWESVLVFPLIAVFCIVLVLVLSLIFFGRREGQQWRDYKTPKEQLNEYVSVRQSQRHLRELSVQRQLLLMAGDHDHTSPPFGVHSFLQPKCKSAANYTADILSTNDSVPVGKQTVAEAARQCGSSLHLYRNPLESETDEENDNDSLDEGDITNNH
uniref:Cadherin_C domain-containing protein n=1 Tax=Angiostrongylus cantonensis TaxID=6313 RepID=A0A0K0DQV1_ANGCA